jgi:hypothetical protein
MVFRVNVACHRYWPERGERGRVQGVVLQFEGGIVDDPVLTVAASRQHIIGVIDPRIFYLPYRCCEGCRGYRQSRISTGHTAPRLRNGRIISSAPGGSVGGDRSLGLTWQAD